MRCTSLSRALTGSVLALAALVVLALPDLAAAADLRAAFEKRIIERVNHHRALHGLTPLRANAELAAAAQAHSEVMLGSGCFAHTCEGEDSLGDRVERAGYLYGLAAENIGAGFDNPEKLVDRWMRSDSHRENMLIPDLTEAGVGFARVPRAADPLELGSYWTLDLGRLRPGVRSGAAIAAPIPERRPARAREAAPETVTEAAARPAVDQASEPHPALKPPPAWIGRARPIKRDR